ncbi:MULTISPECIES: HAD family hydrolase [unclassified Synechococcus]|uniref:HAD family hydrolase n=1 Tax=unclassified Synechococcus TaxID=2626047 RepID=UPI001CF822B6|nr:MULTISPECIES: HAD family hydrolase [unclassified Synechococcus]MCB4376847.1 glycosyltransferase [Synechococcus sp. MU1650]
MGIRLLHLHLHGLFRSHELELGRDADTGGQTLYVLELARSLAQRAEVEQVDVVTRLIQDRRFDLDYSKREEVICPGARILRFPFGPKRYLRKELLWPHLEELADQLVEHLSQPGHRVDWIHAHYADAGLVGALVSQRLGIPLVFTGHSLGREKQRRLLAGGLDRSQIEQTYAISRRIDAEERALAQADLVITSTRQEADQQYSRYGHFQAAQAEVVPPGVDATRFHPHGSSQECSAVESLLQPFLREPDRAPLLAISRAVRRKNIPALVEAYGQSPVLRQRHNLVLVLGCRDDPRQLEKQQRDVLQQVFDLVDRFDLYGQVAYPKQHSRAQIPALYRWAARRGGLFVNPALTEPFGLTLLEAAACGLPMVATDDGGPRDIQHRCDNGLLADVTDPGALQEALELAGSDGPRWRRWSDNGVEAISRHFSWDAHVCQYLALMQKRIRSSPVRALSVVRRPSPVSRLLALDLDSSLELPEESSLAHLRDRLQAEPFSASTGLVILTGRSLAQARQRYHELHLPDPKAWICRAGTEIHHGLDRAADPVWAQRISEAWDRDAVLAAMGHLQEHIRLQDLDHQSRFKVSYLLRASNRGLIGLARQCLRRHALQAEPQLRCHWFLDVLPQRASRSEAIRFLAQSWGLPLERVLVVASQQGDGELLDGLPATVVPADHDPCLLGQRIQQRVYVSKRPSVGAVLDGLTHYRFSGSR